MAPRVPTDMHPVPEIRVVALTYAGGELLAFAERSDGTSTLPKTLPAYGDSLDETGQRLIRTSLGFTEQYIEQLYSLSHVEGQDWSIIVSYLALVRTERDLRWPPSGEWIAPTTPDAFSASDRTVVDYALFRLRAKIGYTTIAFHLMPEVFTLSELQSVFETILGRTLDKRNFRRRMATLGILAPTRQTWREGSHRPARLYRFDPDRDPTDYLTPPWATSQPGE